MRKLTIVMTNEFREILENGQVVRHINGSKEPYRSSEQWRVTGAIVINNFGNIIRRMTLVELLDELSNDKTNLFYKNGKPKFRICDIDGRTNRVWGEIVRFPHRYVVINNP